MPRRASTSLGPSFDVPRAELRAAGLAHAVVAHSPAAAFVYQQDRRPSRIDVAVAELHQRDEHRPQVQALFGQAVLVSKGVFLVRNPAQDAVLDERVEAVGQNVASRAGAPLEILEAARAHERVADDEQRPALADELERAGHRADLGVVGSAKHRTGA